MTTDDLGTGRRPVSGSRDPDAGDSADAGRDAAAAPDHSAPTRAGWCIGCGFEVPVRWRRFQRTTTTTKRDTAGLWCDPCGEKELAAGAVEVVPTTTAVA